MKNNNNKGFTLAELLIVVAVIAVLVAVAIPTFSNQLEKSRQAVDVSNLRGAYAVARLAEIDQAVGQATFKSLYNQDSPTSNLQYWYNPNSGVLTKATQAQVSSSGVESGNAEYGKATSSNIAVDVSQLPVGNNPESPIFSYSTDLQASGTTVTAGTKDKAILVTFGPKTGENGTYEITGIHFVPKATAFEDAPFKVTKLTVTLSDQEARTADATDFSATTFNLAAATGATAIGITGGTLPYTYSIPAGTTGWTIDGNEATSSEAAVGNTGVLVYKGAIEAGSSEGEKNEYTVTVTVGDSREPAEGETATTYAVVVSFKGPAGT